MPYRADVTEPDPSPSIISKYLAEPGPARRVPWYPTSTVGVYTAPIRSKRIGTVRTVL